MRYLEEVKTGVISVPTQKPHPSPTADTKPKQATTPPVTPPSPSYTDIPTSEQAREKARLLVQSKREVPHIYLTVDVDCSVSMKYLHDGKNLKETSTWASKPGGVGE